MSLKVEYRYNDNGLRTHKTIHKAGTTKTTIYHYDQFVQLVSETTDAGDRIRDYLWHDNGEAKVQIDNIRGNDKVIYLHSDHLLTTRLATDQSQEVIWQWEGEAFGNTAALENTDVSINLRFPGQYFDQGTNLQYNCFRCYDPAIGRYITSDPIGLIGGLNTYGYVGANPIALIDPYGLVRARLPPNLRALKIAFELGYITGEGFNRIFESQMGQSFREWLFRHNNPGSCDALYDDTANCDIPKGRLDDLLKAGQQADRNGLIIAGRALQKHGDRDGSVFPKSTGNAAERNQQGQDILDAY